MSNETIERYSDGTWWPNEHKVSARFPLMTRGNTGEVFPNVVTPLTGSIVAEPFGLGQRRCAVAMGLATPKQVEEFDGVTTAMAAMHAGYLYVNVSLSRSATARTPGLTVEMVDTQMFGLSGAPPHRRGAGDRSISAALRAMWVMGRGLLRPDSKRLPAGRALVAAFVADAPGLDASDDALVALGHSVQPVLEVMMHDLLTASAFAGISRSTLERVVGDPGVINPLTAGLGTIESAEPAFDLWRLGRRVAESEGLTALFDDATSRLYERLVECRPTVEVAAFLDEFEAFRHRHGARGPDEWELASPTWGSDPSIALAAIDRLRGAPESRDPVALAVRTAADRDRLRAEVRAGMGRAKRKPFDVALRATDHYQAQREATKAACVRALLPVREAMAELARRSAFEHDDLFLLTLAEVPAALARPDDFADVIAERRWRRDYLQARVPPFWFEGEIPHPSTWVLRSDLRRPDATARQITGMAVCPGVATGTARVVSDPADPRDLEPGDILVAPITDPAWTPLFLAAAGVVVDVGAQMSHAAIVARELGIPAVVSATGASETIPDGATITVDGNTGVVTIHAAG